MMDADLNDPDVVAAPYEDHELIPQASTAIEGELDPSLFEQDEE